MESTLQNLKVLFLEDSEIDIEIVYQKLMDNFKCAITMDKAQNEECFLHLIKNNQYDVILADYTLPGYNAVSALEQSQEICPDTPFICVSGTIGEDFAVEMLKQGAADYVLKDRLQRLPFAIRRAIKTTLLEQERKKAGQAIKELNQSNQLILDSTNDGIELLDKDGNILNINKSFAQRFGKSIEDLIGKNVKEFLPEEKYGDLYEQRLRRIRNVFNSGIPEIFEDSRDGLWFYNRFFPVFNDGNVTAVALFSTEITDRVKMEEEACRNAVLRIEAEMYRKKEEEYLEILDGSTEASWIYSFRNKTLEYSNEWLMRIGGENIPAQDMDAYLRSLVHPDDVQRLIEERMQIHERKLPKFKAEYRLKTVTGYIWVFDQGKITYNENGTPDKIYGTSMDFTERKQTEEALKKSELLLNTIVQNTTDLLFLNDSEGRVVYVNDAYTKTFGIELKDVVGKNALELYHDEDAARIIQETDRKVMQTGKAIVTEERAQTPDGILSTFLVTKSPWKDNDGNIVGVVGVAHDITERKRAEEELGKAYGQIQNIINNTPDIVYAFDLEERFVMANTAVAQLFNSTPEQLMGKRRHEFMPQEDAEWHEANDRIVFKENKALEFEEYNQLNDCSITWLTKKFPLRDNQGRIYAVAGISADISKRKQVEEALRRSEERALMLIDELGKADKNKNQFISVLSHELRNPLAVIVASLSLLKMTNNPEQILKSQEIVKRQVSQLTKLVDDLLELTRINQNKINLKKELINLNDIVKNVAQDHEYEYSTKDIRLLTELPQELIILSADHGRIAQCVGNILQNALKYTPEGGDVALLLEKVNGEAVIHIRDNGMGIDPDLLEQLFEPFTQADTSLDRQNTSGLGLGLSIAKGIAELHGGNVIAFSEGLGKGSLFTIRLPITVPAEENQYPPAMKETVRTHKILLIEDNRSLSDVLCSIFDVMGHEAFAAHSGMEGIAEAKKIRPDVIFCDIGLPGLSGYEVAKILKADAELKNTFLIALTGYAGDSDIEQARHSCFDRHLAKPVDMEKLEKILADIKG